MKRIHKERDRLLRRIARIAGLSGALSALACMAVPGSAGALETGVVVLLGLGTAVLVVVHTMHGSIPAALGAVATALAT
ncbi:MAG TPA: hypothetical protein VGE78_04835, partial [Agromyces sp.]